MPEEELIKNLRKKDKLAIQQLYTRYAPVMLAICLRYSNSREDARDIMHEGFIKILNVIDKFSGSGSFEGWMKRVMVNVCLDHYKKRKKTDTVAFDEEYHDLKSDDYENEFSGDEVDREDLRDKPDSAVVFKADLTKEDILDSINLIPEIYRIIFSLFVLENYTHSEIASALGIEENVSRTRLFRAREMLQKVLYKKSIEKIAK